MDGLGMVLQGVPQRVLYRQFLGGSRPFPVILQNPYRAKDHHTAEVGGVLLWNDLILVDDAEGGRPTDQLQLMPRRTHS